MMTFVEQIRNSSQLRWNRVHKFRAKLSFEIELGPYILKTATNSAELIESFKLRHEVFNQEFRGINRPGLDFDRFDYFFDHLIIIHKESQKIIGTYRLNSSSHSLESYTAIEFDITMLKLHRGPFLELGRACIKKEFRKGSVISLLWRGISEYMGLCGANFLYGCSSLKIINPRDSALVYKYLVEKNKATLDYICRPTKKFRISDFDTWYTFFGKQLSEDHQRQAEELLPPLLKSYLNMGAQIASEPAFDESFNCVDLLTVLRRENLANSLANRFQVAR